MQVARKTDNKTVTRVASKRVLLPKGSGFELVPALIEIQNNKISAVKKLSEKHYEQDVAKLGRDTKVERLDDYLLSPAFVNPHTHLAMAFFRGISFANSKNMVEDIFFKLESKLSADDVRAFSRMGAYENLIHGVGCVWDHYYHGVGIADALVDTGLCGVVAPTLQDLSGPGKKMWEKGLAETETIQQHARYNKNGVFAALGPHATDTVSPKLWATILKTAKKFKLPIHGHLAQSIEEVRRSLKNNGKSPTEFLSDLGIIDYPHNLWAHAIYTTDSDLKKLARGKQTLVFCPFSQVIFQHLAPVFRWNDAKVNWVLATDCVASNDSMNVQKEMRFVGGLANMAASFDESTLSFSKSLKSGALEKVEKRQAEARRWGDNFADGHALLKKVFHATNALHPQVRFGSIDEGCWANLIAWDTKHPSFWPGTEVIRTLAFGDTTQAIANLMIGGQWKVKQFGNFQKSIYETSDYQLARLEADKRLAKLLR